MMITLIRTSQPGVYAELSADGRLNDVAWVRDGYTEPRDGDFDCTVCEKPITEGRFWTCLDGGDAAHDGCVTTEHDAEPAAGSVIDYENTWLPTADQAAGKGTFPFAARCRLCHGQIRRDAADLDWRHI